MKNKHATPEQFLKALAYEFPGLLYAAGIRTNERRDLAVWIEENVKHLSPRIRAEMKSMACVSVGDRIGVKNG